MLDRTTGDFFTGFRNLANFVTGNRDLTPPPWWAPTNGVGIQLTRTLITVHCFVSLHIRIIQPHAFTSDSECRISSSKSLSLIETAL